MLSDGGSAGLDLGEFDNSFLMPEGLLDEPDSPARSPRSNRPTPSSSRPPRSAPSRRLDDSSIDSIDLSAGWGESSDGASASWSIGGVGSVGGVGTWSGVGGGGGLTAPLSLSLGNANSAEGNDVLDESPLLTALSRNLSSASLPLLELDEADPSTE